MGRSIDRISNLPVEIRIHILSFLPTKDAASTTVLSTKWKNLLPLIPNLKLQLVETDFLHLNTFKTFVHNLLNFTLRDTPSIHSLTLSCHEIDDGRLIATWIDAALRLKIKKMDIQIQSNIQHNNVFFDSLNGSDLVSLDLVICFSYYVADLKFCLPQLKELRICCVGFFPLNAILASCPVLEYLALINCSCFLPVKRLQVCIPSLRNLNMVNTISGVNLVIELEAPQLSCLSYSGDPSKCNIRTKKNDVWICSVKRETNSDHVSYYFNEEAALLSESCYGSETLYLTKKFISAMHRDPHHLPRFENLIKLYMSSITAEGWELLPSLINSAPKMKMITIKDLPLETMASDSQHIERFKAAVKDSVTLRFCKRNYGNHLFVFLIERNENRAQL